MGKEAKERVDACVPITTQQIRTQLNIVNQLYVNKNFKKIQEFLPYMAWGLKLHKTRT